MVRASRVIKQPSSRYALGRSSEHPAGGRPARTINFVSFVVQNPDSALNALTGEGEGGEFGHGEALDAEFGHGSAAAPVVGAVDDAGQANDAVHAVGRYAVALTQAGDGHQTHGNLLENVAVIQRGGGFDAVIPGLVVDALVQGVTGDVVGQFQPLEGGAGANPKRRGHGDALAVKHLEHARHGGGHAVDVELEIPVGGLDPTGVEQGEGGVKDGAHVVEAGLEHVDAVDVLGIGFLNLFEHDFGAGGRKGGQGDGILD